MILKKDCRFLPPYSRIRVIDLTVNDAQRIAKQAGRPYHAGLAILSTHNSVHVVNRGRIVATARVWANGKISLEWSAGLMAWK